MHVHRSAAGLAVHAPAKLNLFFEVLAKRQDGYHEIETLMCPIDLYDTLHFQEDAAGQITLKCERVLPACSSSGCGLEEVPDGPENLVVRAVELLRRKSGCSRGAKLRLVKRVPAAAGLGGGSSDAAAALLIANEGWQLGYSREELVRWAAELGSDVPFFLVGGPAVCQGRGEHITPIEGIEQLHFVVVRPPEGLSTASVYRACRPAEQPQSVWSFVEALRKGNWDQVGRGLLNRLQPAAEALSPWMEQLRKEFAEQDFLGHGMSGSGTSYFGLCRHARHARRCARRFQDRGLGAVFVVRSCR
jgi:4-diphosphocytidyl-2-C-methyl-D-erythritol kinase